MKLNFSDLCSKKEVKKSIDFTLDLKEIEFDGEIIKIMEPLKFHGMLNTYDDLINIIGSVTGVLELECSRCLKNFSYNIDIDFDEKFTNNLNKEDDSIILVEDDVLDVIEVIVSNVISTLPIKKLCKNDCKGLCHECGADLNVHSCTCNTEDVDIRMAKLMDLFK